MGGVGVDSDQGAQRMCPGVSALSKMQVVVTGE